MAWKAPSCREVTRIAAAPSPMTTTAPATGAPVSWSLIRPATSAALAVSTSQRCCPAGPFSLLLLVQASVDRATRAVAFDDDLDPMPAGLSANPSAHGNHAHQRN